jgi:O-antigen/teichoic acid export membrane protein
VQSGSLLVLVVALALPFGIPGAVVALFTAHALTAIVFHVRSRRRLAGRVEPDPEPGQLRRALAFGVKGYAGNALQVFNYRVDLLLLSAVATTAVVGQYAVAVAVTTVLWLLPQSISDVLFPRVAALSSAGEGDADAHRAFVEAKSLRHVTLIALVAAGVLALALVFLVVPVYGPDFEASTELGLIRLPGVVLIGIGGVLSATIVGRGRPQYMLYSALISTPLTMVLYAVLIPRWDATGAALASSLSFAMNFVLATYFYRRTTGTNPLRMMAPTRSELADYRGLPSQIAAWARGLRG